MTNRRTAICFIIGALGSLNDIAGIVNKRGNVLGMMPHPERAVELLLGSEDGKGVFESLKAK